MTVVTDNNTTEQTTGELLRSVTRLFSTLQQQNFACCDVNSATQCSILTTLRRGGGQTLSGLTRALNLDKAWLSRSTDDLVTQGLIVKAPHPSDRRALQLELTEAGRDAARELDDTLNAQAARVLSRLGPADRPQAVRLLAALAGALQAELNGPDALTCCAPES
ncbi:MarR family winged helix-turn-helix transcriptional regulator [Deinococcus koreensis]|uniref:MarR family transcriptional regulator n=1 Tax=Deinococcus koreensis TaxID=2054903 RepID=A0A2K3UWN8_9DEIO|nr:MarR family transcriptional regulator [Deinococcus koreensis]PNY80931.1 MarR family transcriptional regulator [Deinococcus koreensis]